ncbi:MAG: double zinc ribbon domain-containing protein [Oscillospiraceae bacterium]|nr:double zinc ribbon domain-containing protein [Oscillospiraceae bacterium]
MGKSHFSFGKFLAGLLFPPRCLCCGAVTGSSPLCANCSAKLHPVGRDPCRFCGRERDRCRCDYGKGLLFEQAVSAYYYEQTGRALLQRFKFRGDIACYDQVLAPLFLEKTAGAFHQVSFDWIVPVPMYEKQRGRFDQTGYLARSLSRHMGIPCRTDLLKKLRKTPPQHLQKARDRGENVKGAFTACKKSELQGVCILLVDDVATTFSTLNECAAALKGAGADRVLCASLMTTAGKIKNQGDQHE